VPYDGVLTKADGRGKWWDGLDPAKLYNPHPAGAPPSREYIDNFFDRTVDLIDQHHPDFVYFDDAVLPLNGTSDVGLRLAAYYYNANQKWHDGKLEAVMTTKRLDLEQRKALTMDIERSVAAGLEPLPWECGTCLGYWHYQRDLFENHGYKTARQVVRMLVDIVSKNGNLLLSVPLRGDGTMDEDERQILEGVAAWMTVNGECIFGTRPWRVYGEGPSVEEKPEMTRFGAAAEARMGKPYTVEDFRFTTNGSALYAIAFEWPESRRLRVRSLAQSSSERPIKNVHLLGGSAPLKWTQTADALEVELPAVKPCEYAYALKIE
jgi:alpha-L-fucosidase